MLKPTRSIPSLSIIAQPVIALGLAALLAPTALGANHSGKASPAARERASTTPGAQATARSARAVSQSAIGRPGAPNILVIVLDDIGIDQAGFAPFGWNLTPDLTPAMPVMTAIAESGVAFTNFWATPECSPSRAAMLTGRYGFRTGVITAIIDPMLPVNQLNPAEITLPKLLSTVGYRTAMIGKYHLGGSPESGNVPPGYGYEAPATTTGLDFYDGYWDLPPSIDTTLGGQSDSGQYTCGGIGGVDVVGAACFPNGTCIDGIAPFDAMALGATPLLDAKGELALTCLDADCASIDYTKTNAYYVWDRVTTEADGSFIEQETPQREYLTDFISAGAADWIKTPDAGDGPWLAFVTHSASHTPIQSPPPSLAPPTDEAPPECSLGAGDPAYRAQFKLMCESVDTSVGDMLVDLGLATRDEGRFALVDPAETNTMIVVFGDNGSFGTTVLAPFSPTYSKQTVYQTGVWTPCVVAGPMVASPNRVVDEMVNVVDLFGLIADSAGVDWHSMIPPNRTIDSVPMLPYLTGTDAPAARQYDFAIYEQGTFAAGQVGPCLVQTQVIDGLITSPGLCADNGGCWLGGSDSAPYRVSNYCDLLDMNGGVFECGGVTYCVSADDPFCTNSTGCDGTCVSPTTTGQWALRSGQWKLIVLTYPSCLAPNDCLIEFYKMAIPSPPAMPGLDQPGTAAQIDISNMNPVEQAMFDELRTELYFLLASEWYCPGDGNKDFRVDAEDVSGLIESWGFAGFWDVNEDGTTDGADLGLVLAGWNPDCVGQVVNDGRGIPSCLSPAIE